MSGNFIVSSCDCISVSCPQASPGPRQISTLVFLPPGSFPYSISFLPLKAKVLTLIIGLEEYLPSQHSYFTLKKRKRKIKRILSLSWGTRRVGEKTSWHGPLRHLVCLGPGSEDEIVELGHTGTSDR